VDAGTVLFAGACVGIIGVALAQDEMNMADMRRMPCTLINLAFRKDLAP
jgi:hypothetical protein